MYCGCGTKKNKTLWCTWLVFLALFIACWVVWPTLGSRCINEAEDKGCSNISSSGSNGSAFTADTTDSNGDAAYVGSYDNECVYDIGVCKTMTAFFYLGILFAILSSIPLWIMCCCSRPPQPKHQQAPVAHTAYGGNQGTYTDGYAGQPASAYGQPAGTYNDGGYGNNQYGGTYGNAQPTPYGGDAYGKPHGSGQPGYAV